MARIPDCTCLDIRILSPKRNLDHRPFVSLGRYVNEFIQIISLFERSSFKLRCETVIGIALCCSQKHVAFFTICAKLRVAFIFTSLPLNYDTSVSGCRCGFGFEQKYWWIDGFSENKRHGSTDLHTTIHLFLNVPLSRTSGKSAMQKKEGGGSSFATFGLCAFACLPSFSFTFQALWKGCFESYTLSYNIQSVSACLYTVPRKVMTSINSIGT